jgi:hypothetical protein
VRRSLVTVCSTGAGIAGVCEALVFRRPSGRSTYWLIAVCSGIRVIFSTASPRIT